MKGFPTLSEFLRRAGVTKETPFDQIESLKIKYRQAYQTQYQLNRKQDTHRYTIRFNNKEFAELKRVVKRYTSNNGVSKQSNLAHFIKKATLAYLSKQYVPHDEKLIKTLWSDIRAIGNNINQTVNTVKRLRRCIRLSGDFKDDEFRALHANYFSLRSFLFDLESRLDEFMQRPTATLKQALQESLRDQPDKIGQLISFLMELKNQNDACGEKQDS